jgi:Na+/H+-translocating membrane pyrophosphatase
MRLRETGIASDSIAQGFWIFCGAVAAVLAQSALLPSRQASGNAGQAMEVNHPAVAYAGVLGAVLVVVYAATVLKSATRSARTMAVEVERQLGGFPRERGRILIPEDYVPSYRTLIEMAGKGALEPSLLLPVAGVLLTPLALALSLAQVVSPATVVAALAAFALAAVATGLVVAFGTGTTRIMMSAVHRQASTKQDLQGSALKANTFAELLGSSVGPASQLLPKIAAIASLIVAPFVS